MQLAMKYYVGIRESMIDRARVASSATMNGQKWCALVRKQDNDRKNDSDELVSALQTLISAGVIKIGATGLEPATS